MTATRSPFLVLRIYGIAQTQHFLSLFQADSDVLVSCKLACSKHSFYNYKNLTPRTLFSGFVAVQLIFLKPLVV